MRQDRAKRETVNGHFDRTCSLKDAASGEQPGRVLPSGSGALGAGATPALRSNRLRGQGPRWPGLCVSNRSADGSCPCGNGCHIAPL